MILIRKVGRSNEFTSSEWWLNRWKMEHGINQMVISGKRISVDHTAARNFIKTSTTLINNCFVPDQIYNTDNTGLNHKMLPHVHTQKKLQSKKSQ
jgi:hypothetical protein